MSETPHPRLEVRDALGRRLVPIETPVFTIGRRSANDLHLTGADVSRDHAEILRTEAGWTVRDKGSRYGTFVQGEQVTERALRHGDRITIGRTGEADLIFLIDDGPEGDPHGASPAAELRQMSLILETLRSMGSGRVLEEVLMLALDSAIEVTGAERGFIMLANTDGALELTLARAAGRIPLPLSGFATSRKIPEQVFTSGQAAIVADLHEGDLMQAHQGTIAMGIRHVLCTPLRLVRYVDRPESTPAPGNIGVLYLDSHEKGRLLSDAARTALETLAREAASAIENARLYRETLEKTRLDQELRTAAQIQQALLPPPRKSAGFFSARGASIPCRAIGGDFFDYLDLPDGRFGFVLGDVAGKGPPAALLTAVLQGMFSAQAFSSDDVGVIMARINQALLARNVAARFATVFFGALSPDGMLAFCNAGHNPPFLFRRDGVQRLEAGGVIVGVLPQAVYIQETVRLIPGDTVVVFSDGISEALGPDGSEFGDERIADAVATVLDQGPDTIVEHLLAAVRTFTTGAPQHDDITALVVKFGE